LSNSNVPAADLLDDMWARHHAEWREPSQITSQWEQAHTTDPELLEYKVRGAWWQTLAECGITLLVTREYEHLLMALGTTPKGKPQQTFMRLPHPSGLAVDRKNGAVMVASTRNPNQIYEMRPVSGYLPRLDVENGDLSTSVGSPLVPVSSRFMAGCLYMHDLAFIGDDLYANAVGHNAIVRLDTRHGGFERVWWPNCIESDTGPVFGQNHIQLNSIAAGENLETSYFSASADKISRRRPGHKNFPVDKRGVIFSGASREPIAYGLTRPHSARLHEGRIWVDNSGYGELGYADLDVRKFVPFVRLPGWTRGLCFYKNIAFVGTSRVIPRFKQYAPGLKVDESLCGLHAVDLNSGKVLGSLLWPYGNQIFAVEWLPARFSTGFAFPVGAKLSEREKKLFYSFTV
jgi:uncharacterized protein (TIGR03032 family)